MKLELNISKATVVEGGGTDKISLDLDEATARRIHGPFFAYFKGASLRLEVTKGRAREALTELGFDLTTVEFININRG